MKTDALTSAQLAVLAMLIATAQAQTLIGAPVGITTQTQSVNNTSPLAAAGSMTAAPAGGAWPSATGAWAGGSAAAGGWPGQATGGAAAGGGWPGVAAAGGAGGAASGAVGGWPGAGSGNGSAAGGAGQWAGGAGGGGQWAGGGAGGGAWRLPEWVATIPPAKIAHVSMGAMAVLFFFPFGASIRGVWYHRHDVWVHAAVMMMGYLVFLAAAALGIYMGAVQKKLGGYHPIMGMILLGLLTIQPFTQLINYFLFRRWPNIRYIGYIHLYTGRLIIMGGMIHGGLGFTYAAKLDRELPMRKGPWPRVVPIMYGIVAGLVAIAYIYINGWHAQKENVRRMSESSDVEHGQEASVIRSHAVRLESARFSDVRASIKRASESAQGGGNDPEKAAAAAAAGASSPPAVPAVPASDALGPPPAAVTQATPATLSRMSSVKRIFKSDAL